MKPKLTSLLTGMCLAISAFTGAPSYATSTTGFSSFHVELTGTTTEDPYLCLTENNGAVVNSCPYDVSLEFNLPIGTAGDKLIEVQSYWGSNAAFSCYAFAYQGVGPSSYTGSAAFAFGSIHEITENPALNVAYNASSIQLICWNVPPGAGIANINWTT